MEGMQYTDEVIHSYVFQISRLRSLEERWNYICRHRNPEMVRKECDRKGIKYEKYKVKRGGYV